MGSTTFYHKKTAPNMKEAYNQLVEDAIDEYGNDPYNGTISTTNGFVDVTKKFKDSGKKLSAFIESAEDVMDKRDCWGICVLEPTLNTNKIRSQVDIHKQYGRRLWDTNYEVWGDNRLLARVSTQINAVKIAREFTEETKLPSKVIITRKLVGSNPLVAEIVYKRSSGERQGEYVLFGWAAE